MNAVVAAAATCGVSVVRRQPDSCRRLHRHRGGEIAEVQEDGGVGAIGAFRQLAQLPAAITAGTESAATARASGGERS